MKKTFIDWLKTIEPNLTDKHNFECQMCGSTDFNNRHKETNRCWTCVDSAMYSLAIWS